MANAMKHRQENTVKCQFCGKSYKAGLRTHEKWCISNPANRQTVAPPEEDDQPYKANRVVGMLEDPDIDTMPIEVLMKKIEETEEDLQVLRQTLDRRLNHLGLQFKEEKKMFAVEVPAVDHRLD